MTMNCLIKTILVKMMKSSWLFGFLCCVFINQAIVDGRDSFASDGVLTLDNHNFVAELQRFKFVLVLYYGNNRESRERLTKLRQLEQELRNKNSLVRLAKLDADRETTAATKYPFERVPLYRLFKNGKSFDFIGLYTVKRIQIWLDLAMNVPIQVNLPTELNSLKASVPVILGCFPEKSPAAAFRNFYEVSEYFVYDHLMPIPRFAVVTSSKLAKAIGLKMGTVTIFKRFEDNVKSVYNEDATNFRKLLKFVEEESKPIVYKHHMIEYGNKIIEASKTFQHVLFMSSDDRNFAETFRDFKAAARKFQNQEKGKEVVFVHVDLKYGDNVEHINFFHIDQKRELPCIRMSKIDRNRSRYIPNKQDLTYNGFVQFTEDVINGHIKKSVRSEEPPSDWDKYDVKVLVGKTYYKFVSNKEKNVFMMYYIPNDANCTEALGVYNKLAKDMKWEHSIVFGSLNVASNDGEVDVHESYPSFRLFTKDGKFHEYHGAIKVWAMKHFIEEGGGKEEKEEDFDGMEYDYKWHDENNPVPSPEEEEKRIDKWEQEEREMVKKLLEIEKESVAMLSEMKRKEKQSNGKENLSYRQEHAREL